MGNFSFLLEEPAYELFARPCVEAEQALAISGASCALNARRAFEMAVIWVYQADPSIRQPYRDNLQSLVHEPTFRTALGDDKLWQALQFVIKTGNIAAHQGKTISAADAMFSLKILFAFVQWIDRCYGTHPQLRRFDPRQVPAVRQARDAAARKVREQEERETRERLARSVDEKDARIAALEEQVRSMAGQLAERKAERQSQPQTTAPESTLGLTEQETRKRFIDLDLRLAGWNLDRDVVRERPVIGMMGQPGKRGFVDYVLNGRDGRPLAIIEAKRTAYDPRQGLQQARLYADCLEAECGRRPVVFLSDGYTTRLVDDRTGGTRPVGEVFSQSDLQRIIDRRDGNRSRSPLSLPVDEDIAGRYYQVEAIRAVCQAFGQGQRRALIVMATGTGKTRVSVALVKLLMEAGLVTNTLFLADRVELVRQAAGAYKDHYPELSTCNLCENRHDTDARIVFSTYQTMINAIDASKTPDGSTVFGAGHFDLIIVDEAHRSIFRKYAVIFDYFDALAVGLTATPRDEVDRNTYDFFHVEHGVPTYVYEYRQALEDNVLVPYDNVEATTKFLDEGITYDDLSDADKERYEEDFGSDEDLDDDKDGTVPAGLPDHIDASALNEWVMNANTVDTVLQDLLDHGIRTAGGERLGKTIIFAQNQRHARFIAERFAERHPREAAEWGIRTALHSDAYAHSVIDEFRRKPEPVIAVSVDMLDTGVDVPEIVNLVFFKKVRSKIRFWQMLGRGTRICDGLDCVDGDGEYVDKRRFRVFDYCGNFEFFREHTTAADESAPITLSQRIFMRQTTIVRALQDPPYVDDTNLVTFRGSLADELHARVSALDGTAVAVRLKRAAVERHRDRSSFEHLGETDVRELTHDIAPLVHYPEQDEYALRFDALMYGLMAAVLDDGGRRGLAEGYRTRVRDVARRLRSRMTIPQVAERRETIRRIAEDHDWLDDAGILELDRIRTELRPLVRYLADGADRRIVITDLTDPVIERKEGEPLDFGDSYEDYKAKLNRAITEHLDDGPIRKLRHNEPLTAEDFTRLETFTYQVMGGRERYESTYHDEPLGLVVRRIARLDHKAAQDAFAGFINHNSLTIEQSTFVHALIDYVERNGYLDSSALAAPPFDRPRPLFQLFDVDQASELVECLKRIKANALAPAA